MKIIDWQLMNCGLNGEISKGIILYGASGSGEKAIILLENLGLSDKIIAVVDSDEKKWGKEWMQYKISSPYKLNAITSKAIIVIASVYLKEIYDFLKNKLNCLQKVCTIFAFRQALHCDIMNDNFNLINNEYIHDYKIKYELWKKNTLFNRDIERQGMISDAVRHIQENQKSLLLCGIQKTGNNTLKTSFSLLKHAKDVKYMLHLSHCNEYTYKIMKETLRDYSFRDIKIISGVRQPIERIISQQWQKISLMYQHNEHCIPSLVDENYDKFINDIILSEKTKGNDFHSGDCYYADIAIWFKDQIEKIFDIDVFKYTFNKEKGYAIIKKNNISIFIYRLDKLYSLEKEIGSFIEDSSFVLKNSNIADEKYYMFAYHQYLEQVKVKKEFFDTLVNSKGMTHFYTDEECKKYKDKWNDKLV